jgi:hypothetical protein
MVFEVGAMTKSPSKRETEEVESTLEVVRSVLERAGIGAERLKNADGFRITVRDNGEPTTGFAHVFDEAKVFIFRLVVTQKASRSRLAAVSEFVTRANNGMFVGNFELDLDTGEVKFKTYVDYRSTKLKSVYVRNAVLAAMEMFEGYSSALAAVMHNKMTVKAAINSVEG